MFGVNFTYSIQTATSNVDMENARHRTESDSDDECPAKSPEMEFVQEEMLNKADGNNKPTPIKLGFFSLTAHQPTKGSHTMLWM